MATDNEVKIFYPDTIEYQPFTSEAVEQLSDAGSTSNKTAGGTELQGGVAVNKARKFPPRPVPIPVVAKELISNNLNSQSRQILSAFTFNKTGSIQIGEYVSGVSGDIRISPNGLVARNSAGITTVSIDGTTGDATFLGTVSAGSVISASISANQITGTIVNAQIADIEWAKITNVQIDSADIISLDADVITTGTLNGIDIKIGSGDNVFKADSNGIYLGDDSFNSAPFRVNMDGDVIASSLTLTNASVGSGSSYTGDPIQASYIGNLTAGHITSGTITVGGTLQPTALVIMESTNTGNSRLRFQRSSRIWEDNTARLGINSIGSPMFIYVNSSEKIVIPSSGQTVFRGGVNSDGGLNVTNGGNLRVNSGYLWVNTGSDHSERLYVEGQGKFIGNIYTNHHDPRSSNSYNQGGSGAYWAYVNCHDVSYHSLGFYDDGVTVKKDGKLQKVSDVEAIKLMRPHPTIKTKDGSPLLDKKSLPLEMFLPAVRQDGTAYKRSSRDIPLIEEEEITYSKDGKESRKIKLVEREDADGESGGQLLALVLGAVRELSNEIELLQEEITVLKKK